MPQYQECPECKSLDVVPTKKYSFRMGKFIDHKFTYHCLACQREWTVGA